MFRSNQSYLMIFLCTLILFSVPVLGQNSMQITIDNAEPRWPSSPHIFEVVGTVTLPSSMQNNSVVIIYTRSGEGGNIQLQMQGSETDKTREPRCRRLRFQEGRENTTWKLRIWLGTEDVSDHSYWIYAVIIRSFDEDGGRRLINLTNNQKSKFEDIMEILKREKFHPIVWTDYEQERAEQNHKHFTKKKKF